MSSSDSSDIDPLEKGEATYVMESFRSSPLSSPQTPRPHKTLKTPPLVLNENSNGVSKDDFFHSFRLRRIVRENHGAAIHACAFFPRREKDVPRREDDGGNILATAGGLQVNFYDNEHCGDHLDIMSHFVVDGYGYAPGVEDPQDELKTLAWVPSDSDAVLAAGGSGGVIHVLSLTRSQELVRWNAHEGGITHLETHPLDGNLLLSVGKDARVRLWNLGAKRALCEYHVKAVVSAAFHPSGLTFFTSTSKGVVVQWEVPEDFIGMSDTDACRTKTRIFGEEGEALLEEAPYIAGPFSYHTQSISKSIVHSFHVKGSSNNNHCRFDISSCGQYFCIGSNSGNVFVYNLATGKLVTVLEHPRSTKAVLCCAFSADDRNIVYVGEDALIWRFDHIDEAVLQEWDDEDDNA
ncbi:hypothetical protein HDU89_005539 [Geranomyces variabilis]|nr:hypothetical protein HDU89_005539 [Geranomyces variabilis]